MAGKDRAGTEMPENSRFPGKTVIGLTGGVGSGKSLILDMLRDRYGALVLQADRVCNTLIENRGPAADAVIGLLGNGITDAEGLIDKKAMAAVIFSDPSLRLGVNRILHPATFDAVVKMIEEAHEELIIYEAALPAEARFNEICSRVLYVYAPRKIRAERLEKSRGYSREKSLAIMRSQLSEKQFRELADAAVDNGGSTEKTLASLDRIMKRWGIRRKA